MIHHCHWSGCQQAQAWIGEYKARIAARQAEYLAQIQPQLDVLRASSRVGAADLGITINSPEPDTTERREKP